jgi:hypothetical protein
VIFFLWDEANTCSNFLRQIRKKGSSRYVLLSTSLLALLRLTFIAGRPPSSIPPCTCTRWDPVNTPNLSALRCRLVGVLLVLARFRSCHLSEISGWGRIWRPDTSPQTGLLRKSYNICMPGFCAVLKSYLNSDSQALCQFINLRRPVKL